MLKPGETAVKISPYMSDVMFNMEYEYAGDGEYNGLEENAEMIIGLLHECNVNEDYIPSVQDLVRDFYSRL